MKKSTRSLGGAALAAALGAVLLLGGTGTFASWSDTASTPAQQIQTGTLDLGTVGLSNFANATVTQCALTCSAPMPYSGGAIVPGDVISLPVNVPVTLTGANLKAEFTATPSRSAPTTSAADIALRDAVSITVVSIGGVAPTSAPASLTLTPALMGTDTTVPVVLEVRFPWGTPGQYNDAMGGTVSLAVAYTLTQIAAG